MSGRKSLAAFAFAVALPLLAPQASMLALAEQPAPMLLAVEPQPLVAETGAGPRSFTIEIADSADERSRGLMFRETMADDHGMLFIFEQEKPVAFWMKNTPMPLDLVFIDQKGEIRAVLPGEPFSEAVITPGAPVRFVLELKAGTAARNGIAAGDHVRHPAIDAIAKPG
jgi:uncharacterized membrane protein (UPF0127 family)